MLGRGGNSRMSKLNAYIGQYVFLYTDDGTKLLCKPLSMGEENTNNYIVDILEPSGKYEKGRGIISEDEVGYVVELPKEIQQGIDMTLKFIPKIKDIQQEMINQDMPSRIEFGKIFFKRHIN
jgi:hypothetical protein